MYIHNFFFSSRRRHTRSTRDWSSDVCSSDLPYAVGIWLAGGPGDDVENDRQDNLGERAGRSPGCLRGEVGAPVVAIPDTEAALCCGKQSLSAVALKIDVEKFDRPLGPSSREFMDRQPKLGLGVILVLVKGPFAECTQDQVEVRALVVGVTETDEPAQAGVPIKQPDEGSQEAGGAFAVVRLHRPEQPDRRVALALILTRHPSQDLAGRVK